MKWVQTSKTRIEAGAYSVTKMETQFGMLYSAFVATGDGYDFLGCGHYSGPDEMKAVCEAHSAKPKK